MIKGTDFARIRKGEKISAREVEDLLAEHPAIAEVAVIPLADRKTGERACACVRLAPGSTDEAVPSLAPCGTLVVGGRL